MSNTENSYDLGPSHSQEAIRSESSEDHYWGYADIGGLCYHPNSVWGKNAKPNHPYGPTIALRQAEDECLCPVRLIKEYFSKTKDREDQSD